MHRELGWRPRPGCDKQRSTCSEKHPQIAAVGARTRSTDRLSAKLVLLTVLAYYPILYSHCPTHPIVCRAALVETCNVRDVRYVLGRRAGPKCATTSSLLPAMLQHLRALAHKQRLVLKLIRKYHDKTIQKLWLSHSRRLKPFLIDKSEHRSASDCSSLRRSCLALACEIAHCHAAKDSCLRICFRRMRQALIM